MELAKCIRQGQDFEKPGTGLVNLDDPVIKICVARRKLILLEFCPNFLVLLQ